MAEIDTENFLIWIKKNKNNSQWIVPVCAYYL